MESIIGIFGSRFEFNFRPREGKIDQSGLGRFYDEPLDFALGIDVDGDVEALPFTKRHAHFPSTFMAQTMNTVSYSGLSTEFLAEVRVTFNAHFYPKDELLSTLPVFIIDIEVRKAPTRVFAGDIDGHLFLRIARKGTTVVQNKAGGCTLSYKADSLQVQDEIVAIGNEKKVIGAKVEENSATVLDVPYSVNEQWVHVATVFWGSHVAGPVLETKRGKVEFAYTRAFKSAAEAVTYAMANEEQIRKKAAAFDKVFLDPAVGKTRADFLAFAHQSFVQNAWLGYLPDGRKWYSSWEGSCQFHSTIDVEYNQAWWYYCFWPELAEVLLDEWSEFTETNKLGLTYMCHDMGSRRTVLEQMYPHPMEVEENANYLLLLLMQWKLAGNDSIVKPKQALIGKIVDHLIGVALTGSGFPTEGTANTIDDASPAIQYAREQTYLGVKTLCALQAASALAKPLEDPALEKRCKAQVALIGKTLEDRAWIGDHYAVCIDKDAKGLNDDGHIFTPSPSKDGTIEGWDAYTLYTSNGMLYLLASGLVPELDIQRIKTDMGTAWRASLGPYGNFHSSTDHSNAWLSQNMHRDFIGMYLGLLIDQFDRYWSFETWENTGGRGGCFVDTYGHNHLRYYPRGATGFGWFFAMAGASVDRAAPGGPAISFRPCIAPVTVPLVQFVDWEADPPRIPVLRTWIEGGEVRAAIDHAASLGEVDLRIEIK
ncbi:MAG: DUF4965 domain-containing protein [Candidatus Lokiarchaeota archaeon]|nr:DUF4965 domain-containing protein [Candidatus Lokiarchaeota archaeon]